MLELDQIHFEPLPAQSLSSHSRWCARRPPARPPRLSVRLVAARRAPDAAGVVRAAAAACGTPARASPALFCGPSCDFESCP